MDHTFASAAREIVHHAQAIQNLAGLIRSEAELATKTDLENWGAKIIEAIKPPQLSDEDLKLLKTLEDQSSKLLSRLKGLDKLTPKQH